MHFAIAYGSLLIACATALIVGGRPERLTALACLVAVALTQLVKYGGDFVSFQIGVFLVDLGLLLGFAVIALKSDRFWPIPLCALQLITVGGHILRLVSSDQHPLIYETMVTAPFYPIMLLLAWGSVRAWRRRKGSKQLWSFRSFFPRAPLLKLRPRQSD